MRTQKHPISVRKTLGNWKEKRLPCFSQSGIPNEFLPLFNFETATAESVKSQVGLLSQFEFLPEGDV